MTISLPAAPLAPQTTAPPGSPPVPMQVGVRTLCEFAARSGDLDLRFTPTPTAQQGREGHLLVAQRRGPDYETEIRLSARCGALLLTGRADGFDAAQAVLEEIKTHRGPIDAIGDNQRTLHWAQARLYAWMLCEARTLERLTIALVYVDVASRQESRLSEQADVATLREFAHRLCARYEAWARLEQAHREARNQWLARLEFPQPAFRPGQRRMAAEVWRSCTQGGTLRVQAPTGIGKSIGTLFPALRAMAQSPAASTPTPPLDRIFVLTARTTGRRPALDAVRMLTRDAAAGARAPLRTVELVAREQACEHPDKACHGDSCPLARGFFDRLPQARATAAEQSLLDHVTMRAVAQAHAVCPYYLSTEMLRWADLVVSDYHYWFDRHAVLYALTIDQGWRVAVLIDESHQLVGRLRGMYSGQARLTDALALRTRAPASLRPRIDELINEWDVLDASSREAQSETADRQWLDVVPEAWLRALQRLNSAVADHLAQHDARGQPEPPSDWLEWHFSNLGFAALAEQFGRHTLCELRRVDGAGPALAADLFEADHTGLRLHNVVPAPFIAPRLAAAHCMVLFSATQMPRDFDLQLLGLPASTTDLVLPNPFDPAHLRVRVLPLSTRIGQRERTLSRLVDTLAAQFHREPGNYLAFFSSFDYLEQARLRLQQHHPEVPVWSQTRQGGDAERAAFLARFEPQGRGVGFAVLGGVFGEGIDLPGKRLIGAFIATLGIPQVDPVNDAIRGRLDELFEQGMAFTYLYPGIQKVIQAAGRVIRTPEDHGTVWLIDERYTWARYRTLLPEDWGL